MRPAKPVSTMDAELKLLLTQLDKDRKSTRLNSSH